MQALAPDGLRTEPLSEKRLYSCRGVLPDFQSGEPICSTFQIEIDLWGHIVHISEPRSNAQESTSAQVAVRRGQRGLVQRVPHALLHMCRLDACLAMSVPAICGACAAWWSTGRFDAVVFLFTTVAVFSAAFGASLLDEFFTFRRSLLHESHPAYEPPTTGFGLLLSGAVAPDLVHSLAYLMLAIGVMCSLWLWLLVGWPMLFFVGFSLLLGYTYSAPPVAYGARGYGLGEAGLYLAFGLLPAVGSYYAQAQVLAPLALWVAVAFGLFAILVIINGNLMHQHRDWLLGKRTLAVSLTRGRAVDLSTLLLVSAYVAILFGASTTILPLRTLVALAALPTAIGVYSRLDREDLSLESGWRLWSATIQGALVTGMLFCVALLTDRLW